MSGSGNSKLGFILIGGALIYFLTKGLFNKTKDEETNPQLGNSGVTQENIDNDEIQIKYYMDNSDFKTTEVIFDQACLEEIAYPNFAHEPYYDFAIYWLAPKMLNNPTGYRGHYIIIDFTYIINNSNAINPVLNPPQNDPILYQLIAEYITNNPDGFSDEAKQLAKAQLIQYYAFIALNPTPYSDAERRKAMDYILANPDSFNADVVHIAQTYEDRTGPRKKVQRNASTNNTLKDNHNDDYYQPGQLRSVTPTIASLSPTMGTPNGEATGDLL